MKRCFLLAIILFGCDSPKTSDKSDAPSMAGETTAKIAERRTCPADEKRAAWILECIKASSEAKSCDQDLKEITTGCQMMAEDSMCPLTTWCHIGSKWISQCTSISIDEKCAEVCKAKKPEEKKE